MSATTTSSLCALCRRPLPPDGGAAATRLCDQCRKMVDNIRPTATAKAPSAEDNASAQDFQPLQGPPPVQEAPPSQSPSRTAAYLSNGGSMPRQAPPANPTGPASAAQRPLVSPAPVSPQSAIV